MSYSRERGPYAPMAFEASPAEGVQPRQHPNADSSARPHAKRFGGASSGAAVWVWRVTAVIGSLTLIMGPAGNAGQAARVLRAQEARAGGPSGQALGSGVLWTLLEARPVSLSEWCGRRRRWGAGVGGAFDPVFGVRRRDPPAVKSHRTNRATGF